MSLAHRLSPLPLAAVIAGCGPAVATPEGGSTGGTSETSPPSTGAPPPVTSTSTSNSTTTPTTSPPIGSTTAGSSSEASGVGTVFLQDPDGGTSDVDCSIPTTDDPFGCPRGEVCRPSNDGGDTWVATHCVPVSRTPDEVGDPCVTEGSPVSGVDSCGPESMCFGVDPDSFEGTCVAYCQGAENPICEDPTTVCVQGNSGTIAACLPACDPLLQDCFAGEPCVGNYGIEGDSANFFCANADAPYVNDLGVRPASCGVGNVAVPTDAIEGCEPEAPCCAAFCDLSLPDTCAEGLQCTSFIPEGQSPGEFNIGVCVSP